MAERIRRAVEAVGPQSSAVELHFTVEQALARAGLRVQREYKVPDRGDGRGGYIDLVCWDELGYAVALELDRRSPRKHSVCKLLGVNAVRVIVLREGVDVGGPPDGIDMVINLGAPRSSRPTKSVATTHLSASGDGAATVDKIERSERS